MPPPPGFSPALASYLLTIYLHSPTVVTATVKSMVRGPGEGLTVTVSLTGAYKTGGLDLPSPPTDTSLKFYVPCKQCPPMKKGNRAVGKWGLGLSLMEMTEVVESEGFR